MKIDQVFHLTPLVQDLETAVARFEAIFGPHIWYRGYEPQVNNREAALMAVGDFVIEPMHPRAPFDGRPATSHYRYLERFGDGIHSLAVYAEDLPEIRTRLEAAGVRASDGGMPSTIFTHPKDFPGLIEFFDAGLVPQHTDINPRRHQDWDAAYWRELHPLGMQYASHVTLVVRDHRAAAKTYADVLDCEILPDQPARTQGAASSYVTFGPDIMLEFAQPSDLASPLGQALETAGESWWGVTFLTQDLDKAQTFLSADHIDAPMTVTDGTIRIDRDWTFGAEYAFTDRPLLGDPRAG